MSNTFADKSGRGLLLAALNKAAAEKGVTFKPTDLLFGSVEESTNPAREVQMPTLLRRTLSSKVKL